MRCQRMRRVSVDVMAVGGHLLYWRTVRRWTPEDLATLAAQAQRSLGQSGRAITAAWIRMIERGGEGRLSSLPLSRLQALALALDIPIQSLIVPAGNTQTPASHYSFVDVMAWYQRQHYDE